MAEPDTTNFRKRSRWKRTIAGILSFVVLSLGILVGAGIYFLPGMIESKAKEFVAEKFNRQLTVRKLDLDWFGLVVRLDGVQLSNQDRETVLASFDHLFVELSPETFSGFNPVVKEVKLVNPMIHIVRDQNRKSNIRDIVTYFMKMEGGDSKKTLFSINNIQVENGTIRVDDEARRKQLLIEELNIGIPFIANMPSEIDIFVRFGISAKINKDKIELTGKSRPAFGKKSGKLGIKLDRLDLPTYLGYFPFDPGFRLKSGKFSTDLDVTFAKRDVDRRPVYVEGDITLQSLWLTEPNGADVFRLPELKINVGKSDITSGEINVERISLKNPGVSLDRNSKGQWNFDRILSAGSWSAEKTEKTEKENGSSSRRPLAINLGQLVISDGRFRLIDNVSGIRLKNNHLSTMLGIRWSRSAEGQNSLVAKGDITLGSLRLSERNGTDVFSIPELKISVGKSDILSGKVGIERVSLKNPKVSLDRNAKGQWNFERLLDTGKPVPGKNGSSGNGKTASGHAWVVDLKQFVVSGGQLQFTDGIFTKPVNVSARNFGFDVNGLLLDVTERRLTVNRIVSSGTRVQVVHSMPELLEKYRKEKRAGIAKDATHKVAAQTGFRFQVKQAGITDWAFHFENRNVKQPIVTRISQLEIATENLSDSMDKPVPLSVRAKVNDRGNISVKGDVAVSPMEANLDVDVRDVDIRFIQPYIDNYVNLSLRQADLSIKGKLALKQEDNILRGQFSGGGAIGNLVAVDQLTGRSVISWKDLAFEGVDVNLEPLSVMIDKAKMSNVAARIILLADGRLNLQNILRSKAGGQKSLAINEEDELAVSGSDKPDQALVAQPVTVGSNRAVVSGSGKKDNFSLVIRKWIVSNGSVRFSDNFIKPRYTANILNLRGAFLNLSNDPATQSRLWLRGQVNGAPLVVSGYINPLGDTLTLNIKAQVKGMELAQFSAYTGKYLGYGIEKGKLSYKATYKVENGKLNAENSLVLDQLTLGEKVESEEAKDLSIELALALLKDSDGVIDINVPIAGSLSDPDFSLGSVVSTMVMNTLKKVVTAPFSFLASLSENEKALSGMVFEPGSSSLSAENEQRLERMAKGLAKRPKIKLEITGLYDEVSDWTGLGELVLQRKVHAMKRKKLGLQSFEEVTVSESEYPELVREVYRNEKFDKPRQLLLFDKTLPVSEMEKLLVQHYASSTDSLILLANRRAEAVKNWLVLKGKFPDERIYLLAGKKGETEKDMPARRVDFNLRWKN